MSRVSDPHGFRPGLICAHPLLTALDQHISSFQGKKRAFPSTRMGSNSPASRGTHRIEDTSIVSDTQNSGAQKATDYIREWFLQHLANPYPSAVEKDSLSELSGIPRSKIDSDMTNWRRRAGWTDIKDSWANSSRDAMRVLIEKVESGQEKRKGVREAVEKMKAYLERREEERVGDWVKEVSDERDRRSHIPSSSSNPLHITSVTSPTVHRTFSASRRPLHWSSPPESTTSRFNQHPLLSTLHPFVTILP